MLISVVADAKHGDQVSQHSWQVPLTLRHGVVHDNLRRRLSGREVLAVLANGLGVNGKNAGIGLHDKNWMCGPRVPTLPLTLTKRKMLSPRSATNSGLDCLKHFRLGRVMGIQ